jgi:hypothetical protein
LTFGLIAVEQTSVSQFRHPHADIIKREWVGRENFHLQPSEGRRMNSGIVTEIPESDEE